MPPEEEDADWGSVGELRLEGSSRAGAVMAFLVAPRLALTAGGASLGAANGSRATFATRRGEVAATVLANERGVALVRLDTHPYDAPLLAPPREPESGRMVGAHWSSAAYVREGVALRFDGVVSELRGDALVLSGDPEDDGRAPLPLGAPVVVDGHVVAVATGLPEAGQGPRDPRTMLATLSPALQSNPLRLLAEPTLTALLHENLHAELRATLELASGEADGNVARFLRRARSADPTWGGLFTPSAPEAQGLVEAPATGYLDPGLLLAFLGALALRDRIEPGTPLGSQHLRAALMQLAADTTNPLEIDAATMAALRARKALVARTHLDSVGAGSAVRDAWTAHYFGVSTRRVARFAADAPSNLPGADKLGFNKYVDALANLIASTDLKPPMSLALFGEWGSGKSFFMGQLETAVRALSEDAEQAERLRLSELALREAELARQQDTDKKKELETALLEHARRAPSPFWPNIFQIRFNAWQYVDTNLWASLVTRILFVLNEGKKGQKDESEQETATRIARREALSRLLLMKEAVAQAEVRSRVAQTQVDIAKKQLMDAEAQKQLAEATKLRALAREVWSDVKVAVTPGTPTTAARAKGEVQAEVQRLAKAIRAAAKSLAKVAGAAPAPASTGTAVNAAAAAAAPVEAELSEAHKALLRTVVAKAREVATETATQEQFASLSEAIDAALRTAPDDDIATALNEMFRDALALQALIYPVVVAPSLADRLETLRFETSTVVGDAKALYAWLRETTATAGSVRSTVEAVLGPGSNTPSSRAWLWIGVVLVAVLAAFAIVPGKEQIAAVLTLVTSVVSGMGYWLRRVREGTVKVGELVTEAKKVQAYIERKLADAERRKLSEVTRAEEELARCRHDVAEASSALQRAIVDQQSAEEELNAIDQGALITRYIADRAASDDYRKHLGLVSIVHRDFEELTERIVDHNRWQTENAFKDDKPEDLGVNRVVLYIDDLDRCPPERVVDVLQAVHLLLAFEMFVVVVGVDVRWIDQSLRVHYAKTLVDGSEGATPTDYLEKIFQMPYWVPDMTDAGAVSLLAELAGGSTVPTRHDGAAGDGGQPGPDTERPDASAAAPHVDVDVDVDVSGTPRPLTRTEAIRLEKSELETFAALAPLLTRSPRSAKRFVNTYRVIKASLTDSELQAFEQDGGLRLVLLLVALMCGTPSIILAMTTAAGEPQTPTPTSDLLAWLDTVSAKASDGDDRERFRRWRQQATAGTWTVDSKVVRPCLDRVLQFSFFR